MVSKKYNKKQTKNISQKHKNKKYKKRHGGDSDDTPKNDQTLPAENVEPQNPPEEVNKEEGKKKGSKSFFCSIPVVSSLIGLIGMCKEPGTEESSTASKSKSPKSASETSAADSSTAVTNTNVSDAKAPDVKTPSTSGTQQDSESEPLVVNKPPVTGGKRKRKTKKSRKSKK